MAEELKPEPWMEPLHRKPMAAVASLDGTVQVPLVCLTVEERDAILDALARQAPAAQGWRLVPVEITPEMERASWEAQYQFLGGTPNEAALLTDVRMSDAQQRAQTRAAYAALLAAAPPPSAHTGEVG